MLSQTLKLSLISLDHQFALQSECAILYEDPSVWELFHILFDTLSGGCEMESNYGFNLHFPN